MFLDSHRDSIRTPANKWKVFNLATIRLAFLQTIGIATTEAYGEGDLIQPNEPPSVCIGRHYFTLTDPITDSNHRAFQTADVITLLTSLLPTGAPLFWTRLKSLHLPSGLTL
jgi:hypothetical protein